jgi:hypothetical protein
VTAITIRAFVAWDPGLVGGTMAHTVTARIVLIENRDRQKDPRGLRPWIEEAALRPPLA